MKKILACIDGSSFSDSVCGHAAWISSRIDASVTLLHVLPHAMERAAHSDLSGSIGVDANKELLEQLTARDEAQGKEEQQKGRLILQHAEAQLREAGVTKINSLKRRGALEETICQWEGDIEIIVIGKRGELAEFDTAHIGSNLEEVARGVHHPLLVTPNVFRPIERFLIAYDGGTSSLKALKYIIAGPLLKGLECHIAAAGDKSDKISQSLDSAATRLREAGFTVHSDLTPGHADDVIRSYTERHSIDLLVTGAYGHSRIRNLIIGSSTTSMIMSCRIPLLLFR